jgi:hypothetical protein
MDPTAGEARAANVLETALDVRDNIVKKCSTLKFMWDSSGIHSFRLLFTTSAEAQGTNQIDQSSTQRLSIVRQ